MNVGIVLNFNTKANRRKHFQNVTRASIIDTMERLSLFCCPDCKAALRVDGPLLTPSGRVKSGAFFCVTCNRAVGAITNFKCDFAHFDPRAASQAAGSTTRTLDWEVCDEAIGFADERLDWHGSWEPLGWEVSSSARDKKAGDELVYTGEFLDVGVQAPQTSLERDRAVRTRWKAHPALSISINRNGRPSSGSLSPTISIPANIHSGSFPPAKRIRHPRRTRSSSAN